MFLSKIWFILVAVLAGVALSVALTAPRPMAQKLEELEGQRLDRAQYAAEQMLKIDAHKWIDRVAKLGRDAIISEALDSASRGSGEIGVQHKTVQSRFRALLPDLGTAGIATIAAVDSSGRVVARVGEGEKDFGENIGGAEIIADALRGFLSDDAWGADRRLLRVAAAPVLSKNHDRIVGALVIGAETGAPFAERLKKNLDVDVALLLRGKVLAATVEASTLSTLPDLVAQHRTEINEVKRTPAISIDVGADTFLAVAAPFPGQASQQEGYYVLIGKKPAKADLTSLLASTSARDLKWNTFPWISLVGTILAVVAIGLLLQRIEVEGPIARLRAELRTLARGEAGRLNDHHYAGRFGGIARDVNAAVEHQSHAPASTGSPAPQGTSADAPPPDSAFAANSLFGPPPGGFASAGPSAISGIASRRSGAATAQQLSTPTTTARICPATARVLTAGFSALLALAAQSGRPARGTRGDLRDRRRRRHARPGSLPGIPRGETPVWRIDGRSHARQVQPAPAREQDRADGQARLQHGPLLRLHQGRQSLAARHSRQVVVSFYGGVVRCRSHAPGPPSLRPAKLDCARFSRQRETHCRLRGVQPCVWGAPSSEAGLRSLFKSEGDPEIAGSVGSGLAAAP